jgi:hypothetical protein
VTPAPGPAGTPPGDVCFPGGRRLCAHADRDGAGMHWLQPGQTCRSDGDDDRLPRTVPGRDEPVAIQDMIAAHNP